MINTIWLVLMGGGILVAAFQCLGLDYSSASGLVMNPSFEPLTTLTSGLFSSAKASVELALGLVGIMALWLGLMRIAEESGLVKIFARAVRPIMIRLFPEVPPEHPAMGAMVMNIAANMLGLGNAATPLGLKAMQELQKLNKVKDTATNAMATFMALNTSSVTFIPATIIGIRAAANASNPAEIIGPVILATGVSTTVAIIMIKFLQKLPKYKLEVPEATAIDEQGEI
ncbi:MAG: nucleoside recognition protein [Candidatus Marinimicrobia bacterium]|jgi:spore maturation protein A|nr:nucleoside recognition protein [Candidatus Neomarinimicrobiota bacterium]MBT3574810.1 nucleoside recognition protein [Candidatus Neomarinimicrobiota bacterium]MBT3681196.1 nucleoside recognition protein [Candidatus Neomarinimicrobiota bacterium]MBT3950189.1 nucleoside recognition protein [Candidatus Neomarinimicrobiota bacterium]MBT4254081.1 nucleoside recognition protein [Candidatus Neomarinimicrobiota bacterium]